MSLPLPCWSYNSDSSESRSRRLKDCVHRGLGQRLNKQKNHSFRESEIGWLFAFVYTDALLADFVPNLIRMGMNKAERFENLRRIAQYQMQVLMEAERIKELPEGGDLPK